jgi:glycosyltransferase involved in cell wall biosynthesis
MSEQKNYRVMWLLNHGTARQFEVPMLKSLGVREIFLPKIIPADYNFRSASIDFSEDENLTIPREHLAILNGVDWYGEVAPDIWELANRYFDIVFFILHRFEAFSNVTRNFKGAAIWRVYGVDASMSYSTILDMTRNAGAWSDLRRMGNRFWFGEAYSHLNLIERSPLKERAALLPVGLSEDRIRSTWTGTRKKLFFLCSELGFNPYYKKVYEEFRKSFSEFDFVVGGAQPIPVRDERVLGYVPAEEHTRNMQELRVMFYHSTEPNHVHYHPFEAIRVGMPLVFMAGGLLDRLGGVGLPGRCESIDEARSKIRRILDDDWKLIDQIRSTQPRLLEPMRPEVCRPMWERNFRTILSELELSRRSEPNPVARKKKRIAILPTIACRGRALRAAKLIAIALRNASRSAGEDVDIVFGHIDDPKSHDVRDFEDLPAEIARRAFSWTTLDGPSARRAMAYAGFEHWQPGSEAYTVPDDCIGHFSDCDLWLIVSDRLPLPLLPVRPYVLLAHDYLQRYLRRDSGLPEYSFLSAARLAQRVLVTTRFTENDALQYAGVAPEKVLRLPFLVPRFVPIARNASQTTQPYFVWLANAGSHGDYTDAFSALRIYWEEMGGSLDCHVTGANSSQLLDESLPYLKLLGSSKADIELNRARIGLRGELPDTLYRREVGNAVFLWHTPELEDDVFGVIEAAYLGVPSLSSDYPAMREIDDQFGLNLAWMHHDGPRRMASALRSMEDDANRRRTLLPTGEALRNQDTEALERQYWKAVRECL